MKKIASKGEIEALLFICILVLSTFFLRNLFRYSALFFLTPIRNGIVNDLRVDLHKKIVSHFLYFFYKKRKGDLTSRLTSDLVEIEWSIMSSLGNDFQRSSNYNCVFGDFNYNKPKANTVRCCFISYYWYNYWINRKITKKIIG